MSRYERSSQLNFTCAVARVGLKKKKKNLSVDTPQRKILFPKKQFLTQTFADTNIQSFPCLRMPNRHLAAETFSRPLL